MKKTRMTWRRETRAKVHAKCGGRCAYCGTEITVEAMQIDHIHPRSFGGTNAIENLLPSCRHCNNYKAVFSLEEFRRMVASQIELCRKYSRNFRTAERFGFVSVSVPTEVRFYFETADS